MKLSKTIAIATLLATTSFSAFAGSYSAGCTKEPRSAWMSTSDMKAKAETAGFAVSRVKVSGSCYEVYARKGADRFENFYNPVTGVLVHSQED